VKLHARKAESAMARASSNGSERRQSTMVRRGEVHGPSTSPMDRSAQCTATPVRRSLGTFRLRGTVTSGGVSGCFCAQPQ
jgi:hypothetical protein